MVETVPADPVAAGAVAAGVVSTDAVAKGDAVAGRLWSLRKPATARVTSLQWLA